MTPIQLNNIPQIIKLKVGLQQNTLLIFTVSPFLPAEKPLLLSRGLNITVKTCIGRIPDHVI